MLRAIDLCGGAGGWACAARGLPIHITHAFDRDPAALATYALNHPRTACVVTDLTRPAVAWDRLQVDLVLGGIPCETISPWRKLTKRSRTKAHERDAYLDLLDSCLGIVKVLDPRWWCLEDVVPIVKDLPILTPYQIIQAGRYGPQNRKRAYIGNFPPPERSHDKRVLRDCLRPGPHRIGKRALGLPAVERHAAWDGRTVFAWPADRKAKTVCTFTSRRDREFVVVEPGRPNRQLEWHEAARAQGFPEDYLFVGSPMTVASHIGQAIQIDTGAAILRAILQQEGTKPTCT